jgi:RNA polymerase sigma-70 factor (ECF subfamily)
MLALRARGRIRLGTPAAGADAAAREVVDAFFAATGRGDFEGLLAVLAPDVEFRTLGPEGTFVVKGADKVVAQARAGARAGARPDARIHPATINGSPGVLITIGGRPVTAMAFTVTDGAITAIRALNDQHRLAQAVPRGSRDQK